MHSILMKLTSLPENGLRNVVKATDTLCHLIHYLVGWLSVISTSFALSIVSAATELLKEPDPQLSSSQYHELLLQAWDNATGIAFNVGGIYFAIVYTGFAVKYLLKKQRCRSESSDVKLK